MKLLLLTVAALAIFGQSLSQNPCSANIGDFLLYLQGCEYTGSGTQLENSLLRVYPQPQITHINHENAVVLIKLLNSLKPNTFTPDNQKFIDFVVASLMKQQVTGNFNNNVLSSILLLIKAIEQNPSQQVPSFIVRVIENHLKPTTITTPSTKIVSITITHIDGQSISELVTLLHTLKNNEQNNPLNRKAIQIVIDTLLNEKITESYNQNILPLTVNFINQIQTNPSQTLQLLIIANEIKDIGQPKQPSIKTFKITQLDYDTVPILITFLNSLKNGQSNSTNQVLIELVIDALQNQLVTGKYNQNVFFSIIQLFNELQNNPSNTSRMPFIVSEILNPSKVRKPTTLKLTVNELNSQTTPEVIAFMESLKGTTTDARIRQLIQTVINSIEVQVITGKYKKNALIPLLKLINLIEVTNINIDRIEHLVSVIENPELRIKTLPFT